MLRTSWKYRLRPVCDGVCCVDISIGNNVYDLIYDQTKMREHLFVCFEQQKITTFPLYEKRNTEKVVTYKETSLPCNKPRHSARLK